jgi:polysaccharide biosynthesis protein PslJ
MAAVPSERRRVVPLWIVAFGVAALLVSVPFGQKAAAAGAAFFLIATLLALVETRGTIWTWSNAMILMVGVIWLIPIRLYRFPIDIGFSVEPYRVLTLALTIALLVWAATRKGSISAAGAARPLTLLAAVAIVAQIANFGTLNATTGEDTAIKALSYFLSFIVVFVLVASVITSMERVDTVLRALVVGAAIVAFFALYEGRNGYNIFDHLAEWIPGLERQAREIFEVRGGRLRVHASAQHPIALGVGLAMIVPFGLYLSARASTVLRSRLWIAAAGLIAMGAVSTISRTTVVMFVTMIVVAVWLRGRVVVRYWPLLLILPVVIHFVAPGALGGLYKSFSPKEGLTTELGSRPGLTGSGRLADIDPGLQLWEESPIVGHGLGSLLTTPTEPGFPLSGVLIIFDDQYLNTLVSMGAVGLFAVVWFVWGSVIKLARGARRRGSSSDLVAACCISAAGFATSMFVFDAFSFVQATLMFFIVAAIGLRAREFREQSAPSAAVGST